MKTFILLLTLSFCFGFTPNSDCGDGTVYANKIQTGTDKRFADYPKINGIPKFKGGDKKLNKLVSKNIELSNEAKTQMFNLNYQFTVTCEGKIKDVKQIGDPKANGWTNIAEVIQSTEENWTPAKKEGKPVDCVYFTQVFINGGRY